MSSDDRQDTGLAWAGIGAASGAAARSARERRIKKAKEDEADIPKRKEAQRQAEHQMFLEATAGTPTGTPKGTPTGGAPLELLQSNASDVPILHPPPQLLATFTDPSQLPPRCMCLLHCSSSQELAVIAVIYQRQFSCSVDVFRKGKVDGGQEGQHWYNVTPHINCSQIPREVIHRDNGVYSFKCLWNNCFLAAHKGARLF